MRLHISAKSGSTLPSLILADPKHSLGRRNAAGGKKVCPCDQDGAKEEKKKGDVEMKVTKVYVVGGGVKRPSFHHDATTAVDHKGGTRHVRSVFVAGNIRLEQQRAEDQSSKSKCDQWGQRVDLRCTTGFGW